MAVVTELVTKFGFTGSLTPLDNFNKGLGGAIAGLAAMGTALVAAAGGFARWASGVLDAIDPVEQLSREIGVAIGEIQTLGFVASVNGSSAQAMQASLRQLADTAGLAANGMGRGREAFETLGISVRDANGQVKSADVLLREIAKRFNELDLSLGERLGFARRLGLDASLVQTLALTSDEMERYSALARELGVLTDEQGDAAADYNDSVTVLRFGLDALRQLIAVGVAPQLTKLTENFTDLLVANRDWIVGGVEATVNVVGSLVASIMRMAPVLAVVAAGFVAAKIAALGFAGVMAIVLSPVVLWTAAIAAAWLILDDLITAFRGGESVIADFFQGFLGIDIVPLLHGIADAVKYMIGFVVEGIGHIGELFTLLYKIATFSPIAALIRAGLSIGDILTNTTIGPSAETVSGQRGDDNRQVNQEINIEIKTDDPQRAGASVRDSLQDQLSDAQLQLNRGGR